MPYSDDPDLARLIALLDLPQCPVCGAATSRTPAGQLRLCEACTIREVGMSPAENAARIAAGITVKAWLKRPVDEPTRTPTAAAPATRVYGAAPLRDR